MVKQVRPNSLAKCLGLEESENKVVSKRVVSPDIQDLIAKIPYRIGTVAINRKLVSEKKGVLKKLKPILIRHMRNQEVTYE